MKKFLVSFGLCLCFGLAVSPVITHADVNDFVINEFTADYFPENPVRAGAFMYGLAFVLVFLDFTLHSWISLGLILSALVVALFAVLMPQRTPKCVAADEAIQGLKL